MEVRLDKWLQVARIFKTRSQATRACGLGRVRVNGVRAKARYTVQIEDLVEIEKGDWTRMVEVADLKDKSVPKAEAAALYTDHTPPRPSNPQDRLMRRAPVAREKGAGRPTKKQRREMDRWRRGEA